MSSKIYTIENDKPNFSIKGMAWHKDGSKKRFFKKCKCVSTFKNGSKKGLTSARVFTLFKMAAKKVLKRVFASFRTLSQSIQ